MSSNSVVIVGQNKKSRVTNLKRFTLLVIVVLLISSCSEGVVNDTGTELSDNSSSVETPKLIGKLAISDPPENSDHGYLLADDRIPSIQTCDEWSSFWEGAGPALSFEVAQKYSDLEDLEVSTQIYLKNSQLDEDGNGVICHEDTEFVLTLPEDVNDPNHRLETEQCRLKSKQLGVGFPRPEGLLPIDGTISAVMLFVEFRNFKVTENLDLEARAYYEKFVEFMAIQSGGNQKWNFTVPNKVFYIDKDPSVYGADFTDPNFSHPDIKSYFQDAVNAADDDIDFSEYDVVYVLPPKNIGSTISFGPAFVNLPQGYIVSDEGSIRAGATAGNDSRLGNNSEPWQWLAHETGHLYGLQHPLYELDQVDEYGRQYGDVLLPEVWDLMTWMRTPSPHFWGWSKFWLEWFDDSQVYCTKYENIGDGVKIHLNYSDQKVDSNEIAYVVIPLNKTRAIAVEARTLFGQSKTLIQEIDVTKGDKEGQIRVIPANENRIEGWLDGGLESNQSLVHENLKFSVLAETQKGIILEVKSD